MASGSFSRLISGRVVLLVWGFLLGGCDKGPGPVEAPGNLYLELESRVGLAPLVLHTGVYSNGNGEQFTVSTFKYYLSNIRLQKPDGSQYAIPNGYFLVDASVAGSEHLALGPVPAGDYTGLRFTVGVDSARNVAGAQTGALDPVNGMFWDWNSGYIFMRLEGTSPASATGRLLFSIIGFQKPYNTLRTIALPFGGTTLRVIPGHEPEIHLSVDVQKMFAGPAPVRFADVYDSEGGPSSVRVADNYAAGMFQLDHLHSN